MTDSKAASVHGAREQFAAAVPPEAGLGRLPEEMAPCSWCGSGAHGAHECPTCPEYEEDGAHGW